MDCTGLICSRGWEIALVEFVALELRKQDIVVEFSAFIDLGLFESVNFGTKVEVVLVGFTVNQA